MSQYVQWNQERQEALPSFVAEAKLLAIEYHPDPPDSTSDTHKGRKKLKSSSFHNIKKVIVANLCGESSFSATSDSSVDLKDAKKLRLEEEEISLWDEAVIGDSLATMFNYLDQSKMMESDQVFSSRRTRSLEGSSKCIQSPLSSPSVEDNIEEC